ncbi:MAG: hypothetical protein LBK23_11505 [Oscillospiraceae bacterium]|jgi:hypothetical protein|nr:hypothetical protein [Oscillospiraceae bacterium]
MKKASKAIFKRLDALNIRAVDDIPDIAFITHEGEVWRVDEHYYSPRGNRYKQSTINAPDEYVAEARHIFIDDIDEWE